jgi:hypothetical protein
MFRQQTAATEEDLAIMKAQYAATQDLDEKRIRYLEDCDAQTEVREARSEEHTNPCRASLNPRSPRDPILASAHSPFAISPSCGRCRLSLRVRTVEERCSLELEGYQTDVSKMRQKLRKFEQNLVSFMAAQMADYYDPATASTSSSSSSADSVPARSPSSARQLQQSQRRGGQQSVAPSRLTAKFALLDDDVEQLQSELATLARKISST